MDLDFSKGSGSPKNQIANNVYADEMTIIKATDQSKQPMPWGQSFDLAIELEGKVAGFEYPVKYTLKANFEKDPEGNITNWGGAFVIRDFMIDTDYLEGKDELIRKEISTLLQQGKIPESFLHHLIGSKVWKASYVCGTKEDGKPKYRTFNKLTKSFDTLKKQWESSIANGYPNDYVAETPDSGQTSFNFGANVASMPNHPNAEHFKP